MSRSNWATALTVSGVTLIGQRISALRYNGLETLSLVGARIVMPAGVHGPAIQGVGVGTTKGTMSIVDTQIEFEAAAPENVAIASNRSVYLGNVWVPEAGWGTPGVVNVKQAPYNASGDGRTDDTQALQRAIDEHDVVLLPKGTYCVSRTRKLRENTLLVGLRHMSTIAAGPTAGGDFTDPGDPRPILQSPDSGEWGNRPHRVAGPNANSPRSPITRR